MEKKKNIIYITGVDTVGVDEEVARIEYFFRERHSEDNIHRYQLSSISDWRGLEQETQAMGLFVEKRLFVFRGHTGVDGRKKSPGEKEETLMRIVEHVDDDTFIIFAVEGDGPLIAWLDKNADKRKYDSLYDASIWQKRHSDLEEKVIHRVISEYRKRADTYEDTSIDISRAIHETLEKLSLLSLSKTLSDTDIDLSITLESGGRIFDLVDAIMAGDVQKSLGIYRRIQDETTSFALLSSLISLVRNGVYTRYLKEKGYREDQISGITGAHPYVVKKSFSSRVSWRSLRDFYDKILEANVAYRSGRGLHDSELGRIFAIERALLSLKK